MATTSCSRSTISSAIRSSQGSGDLEVGRFSPVRQRRRPQLVSRREGNYIDPDTACASGRLGVSAALPAGAFRSRCRYDFNASVLTAVQRRRPGCGMLVGNLKINNDLKAFANAVVRAIEGPFRRASGARLFHRSERLGRIAGRFMQGGPRITDRKSDLFEWRCRAGRSDEVVRLGCRVHPWRGQGLEQRPAIITTRCCGYAATGIRRTRSDGI